MADSGNDSGQPEGDQEDPDLEEVSLDLSSSSGAASLSSSLNASKSSSTLDCAPSRSPAKRMKKIREEKIARGIPVKINTVHDRRNPDSAINILKRMFEDGTHSQRSVV
jgi:hypothetical protein